MVTVAVTGGTGVVGWAVVNHLVAHGFTVRTLARDPLGAGRLGGAGAEPVVGHLLDPTALDRLTRGAELVFHVAGVNRLCSHDPEGMWQVNVVGTRMVLDACRRSGVRRLVHTSSATTIGEEEGVVADEATEHRGRYLSHYERTKTESERLALSRGGPFEVVAVNPSSVQGPGRATGTGRLLLQAARGRVPIAVDAVFSVVDIDDCARGHLLAAEHGRPGERYILSGATLTTRRMLALVASATGHSHRTRFLRPEMLTLLTPVVAGAGWLAGREPSLCPEAVRVLRHGHRHDGSRATSELGLDYTPVEETVRRTVQWFHSEGLLTRQPSRSRHPA